MNKNINFIPQIQNSLILIGERLAQIKSLPSIKPSLKLRRDSIARTVYSTSKIEGNALTLTNVTDLVNGQKVIGDKKSILEVKNAVSLYGQIELFNPVSEQDFLLSHKILTNKLLKSSGKYRKVNVGIKASANSFKMVFPHFSKVEKLCRELFEYISNSQDNYIIKSCLIHYLCVSIHPFEDGNGRISRFWQSLFLFKINPVFKIIPIESYIRERQSDYYEYLNLSQKADDPTGFVHFLLEVMASALAEFLTFDFEKNESKQKVRILRAFEYFGNKVFSRKDYLKVHFNISDAMATKDLKFAYDNGYLEKKGNKNSTTYVFLLRN